MSSVSNININNELISFSLLNNNKNIKISLANSIRRSIISNINTYCIDLN